MTDLDTLIGRLKADGGRYLLSVGLTNEEISAAEQPTYGGKGTRRWLTDEEYQSLCGLTDALEQMRVREKRTEEEYWVPLVAGLRAELAECKQLGNALWIAGDSWAQNGISEAAELMRALEAYHAARAQAGGK